MSSRVLRARADLAERVSLFLPGDKAWHQQTVAKVEGRRRAVDIDEAQALASALEMSLEQLLTDFSRGVAPESVRLTIEKLREQVSIFEPEVAKREAEMEKLTLEREVKYRQLVSLQDQLRKDRLALQMWTKYLQKRRTDRRG